MNRTDSAFTLVETLVWMAAITVVSSLLIWALASAGGASRAVCNSAQRGSVRIHVLRRVGGDVRNSIRILKQAGPLKSDKDTLILDGPGARRVIYRTDGQRLYRVTFRNGSKREVPVAVVRGLSFRYAPGGPRDSRWVEVHMGGEKALVLRARFHVIGSEADFGRTGARRRGG